MIFFHGKWKIADQEGSCYSIIPDDVGEGHTFHLFWKPNQDPEAAPMFYTGKFHATEWDQKTNKPTRSMHAGPGCRFDFTFTHAPTEDRIGRVEIKLVWLGTDAMMDLHSLTELSENLATYKDGEKASIYAGIVSPGHADMESQLLVLPLYNDSGISASTSILLLSLSTTDGKPAPKVKEHKIVFESWARPERGKGTFVAKSQDWCLEGESRRGDPKQLHVRMLPTEATTAGGVEKHDGPDFVPITLIYGGSFFVIPIGLQLKNSSGMTVQYLITREDPHLVEDVFSLGTDVLSFALPDAVKPNTWLGYVKKGFDIYKKVKMVLNPLSEIELAKNTLDFIARKDGKVPSSDLLAHGDTILFWDFDGTFSGGQLTLVLTWFDFDNEEYKLIFRTVKRTFGPHMLGNKHVFDAADLMDPGAWYQGLRLRPTMKDPLPEGWERQDDKYIYLCQSNFAINYYGNKIRALEMNKKGGYIPDGSDPNCWPNGTVFDPSSTWQYKKSFDPSSSTVSNGDIVGYLDGANDSMHIQGDSSEFQDGGVTETVGTYCRQFNCHPDITIDPTQPTRTGRLIWSHKVVFFENTIIEKGDKNKYKVKKLTMGPQITDPKRGNDRKAEDYEPFLQCVQQGLATGDNWKEYIWAYWWDPGTKNVHAAIYMSRATDDERALGPWVLKRKGPQSGDPKGAKYPVVAFVSKWHIPLNFSSFDKDNAIKKK